MTNLLKADFRRLLKSNSFKIIGGISLGMILLNLGLVWLLFVMLDFEEASNISISSLMGTLGSNVISTVSISSLGLFVAIAIGIFNSRDFGENTIRNKITAGYSRTEIYFSALIVNLVMFAILFVSNAIFAALLGLIFCEISISTFFFLDLLMMFLVGAAFSCIISFFSFVSQNLAGPLVFGILSCQFLTLISSVISQFYFEFYFNSVMGGGFVNYIFLGILTRINLFAMDGVIFSLPEFIDMLAGAYSGSELYFSMWYVNIFATSVVWGGGFAALGIPAFRKKDIK